MTLEELAAVCQKKARAIDDPSDPSVGFVLVMVKLNPDDSAHIVNATTLDRADALPALARAFEMIAGVPINLVTARPKTEGLPS
jgi:hypothetical protein